MSSGETPNPELLLMDRTVLCMSLMCEVLSPCRKCVQCVYHLVTVIYRPSREPFFSTKCSKIKPAVRRSTKQQRDTISNLVDEAEQKRQMFPSGAGADRNRSKRGVNIRIRIRRVARKPSVSSPIGSWLTWRSLGFALSLLLLPSCFSGAGSVDMWMRWMRSSFSS